MNNQCIKRIRSNNRDIIVPPPLAIESTMKFDEHFELKRGVYVMAAGLGERQGREDTLLND